MWKELRHLIGRRSAVITPVIETQVASQPEVIEVAKSSQALQVPLPLGLRAYNGNYGPLLAPPEWLEVNTLRPEVIQHGDPSEIRQMIYEYGIKPCDIIVLRLGR